MMAARPGSLRESLAVFFTTHLINKWTSRGSMIGPPSYRRCPGACSVVPLTCAGRPWRRLQVGSDGALFGCVTKWQSDRGGGRVSLPADRGFLGLL